MGEIKHARLAMLAAAGWPVAELYDGGLAKLLGASSPIETNGAFPLQFLMVVSASYPPSTGLLSSSQLPAWSSLAFKTKTFQVTTDSIPWDFIPRIPRRDRKCRIRSLHMAALR